MARKSIRSMVSSIGMGVFAAAAVCAFATPLAARADGARRPMALMIMVDGLRADAVDSGLMPNLDALRLGKWQGGYKAAWSLTAHIAPGADPSSAPNHISIATGYTPATHGGKANGQTASVNYTAYPTWLKRVVDVDPGKSALFVYSWSEDADLGPADNVEFIGAADNVNAATLSARLASANAPDATMYFINLPDEAGHSGGFFPMSSAYRAALAAADGYIGACLSAIANRATFDQEDWLIAVTSDHGGYKTYHGQILNSQGQSYQAYTVPLVIAGRSVAEGRIPGLPYNYDVCASALDHFGVTVSGLPAIKRDGSAETARTLNDGLAVYLPFDADSSNQIAGSSVTAEPSTATAPAVTVNGMTGSYLNIPSGAYLKLAGSENLTYEGGDKSFTAIVWVNVTTTPSSDPVVIANKNWGGSAKGVLLCHGKAYSYKDTTISNQRSAFSLNAGTGSSRLDIGPFDQENGKWTFFAITRNDDGVFTMYQGRSDGTLDWASATLDGFVLKNYPFYIGQDGTGAYSSKFVGGVDDVALWTRGLSHGEIRRIFENGRAGANLGDLLKVDAHDAPTMDVASEGGAYTLTFGGRRTGTHGLYVAYGADDAGTDKYAWTSFAKLADITAATTTYTYTVPDALKAANAKFRFFLMQTENLPYAKEVEYTHSDGTAWIDSGIAPRRELVTEFDMQFTGDNTEWGTGQNYTQTAIYENIFGAFCGTDKRGNYGMCRYRRSGDASNNKWDREYTGYANAPTAVKAYQFVGSCVNNTDYHVVFSTTNLVVNGTAYGSGIALSDFIEGGYGIALYRNLKNGAIYDDTMIGYFRNFSLYTPKRKVRDYVPAVDSEGTAGMFDAVTGQFQTSAATAFTAGPDRDAARRGWVRCVSEEVYTASDTTPVTAAYTGRGADPLDFSDAANWVCTNVYGNALDGAVPTAETAVTVSGETAFAVTNGAAMPACASLTFADAMPTNVLDWRGLDFSKVTANSIIDVRGRTLFLVDESSAALSAFTITDSSHGEPGTVRISVASGATLANGGVALTGNLKLRKEGEGVFSAAKAGQTYTGGTDVIAGTVRVGSSGASHFGSGAVVVPAGATYDAYGNNDSSVSIVLAGGRITNTGGNATLPSALALEEDSVLEFAVLSSTHDMSMPSGAVWNLGGKTLSVVMDGTDPDLNVKDVTISNGTFTVSVNAYGGVTKGYVQIYKLRGGDGLNLDLGNTYLRLATTGVADSQVRDFTANPPDQANVVYSHSTNRMQIHGVYTPQTVRGFNMTMMDGSTLDLSQWSGAYNCVFTNPEYSGSTANTLCDLQFAAGTVTVNLDGRGDLREIAKSESPYIVTWATKPSDTVSFVLDDATAAHGYEVRVRDAGLELVPPYGFMLIVR